MSETLDNITATQKAISLENLSEFKTKLEEACENKYLDKPTKEGEAGQILTKTEDGVKWQDSSEGVTQQDVEKTIDEALYESIEYVDLGLPSGLLWATCNLCAESETDTGLYFQWGDTKGYKSACTEVESDGNDDAHYFASTKYKFSEEGKYIKYCLDASKGTVDKKTVLDPEDDAVTVMLGSQWRMPTTEECQELIDNTEPGDGTDEYGWIKNYKGSGVNGCLLKSKINGNTIFFPRNGTCSFDRFYSSEIAGSVWSSSLSSGSAHGDSMRYASTFKPHVGAYTTRTSGLPIRGVKKMIHSTKQPKFQPRLPEGETGQVLTKTDDGVAWAESESGMQDAPTDGQNYVRNNGEWVTIEDIINEVNRNIGDVLPGDPNVDDCVNVGVSENKRLVTFATRNNGSFPNISDKLSVGQEIHFIISNIHSSDIVISIPTTYKTNCESLTIPSGTFGEINVIKSSQDVYLRAIV